MIRPMLRFVCLSVATSLLLVEPAPAFRHKQTQGPATLEASSDSEGETMALADVLYVTVTVEGGKGLDVDGPLRLSDEVKWEVVAATPPRLKTEEDGRVRWQQTLTLAPTSPGEQPLGMAPLTYRNGEGDKQTVRWAPVGVKIVTTIKDSDTNSARDISAIEDLPPLPPSTNPWPWISLGLLVGVLALGGVWLTFRQRSRQAPASALHKAMRECDRVLALRRGDGKSRVVLLTGVLRRYLERRFGIPARRQTTAELLRAVDACREISDDRRSWLRGFCEQTDLIKYAAAAVTDQRCRELAEEIRQFCSDTAAARAG